MSAQFFCLSFAGDTGDTGDMKNLKIYTIIQVKPKYADLLTRWFDSTQLPSVLARRKKNHKLFGLNLEFIYGVEMKISNFQNFSMIAKSEIDRFVFSLC